MVAVIFQIDKWSAEDWGTWATVLVQALLLVTVFVAWLQLKADHKRSRRERTLDLMKFWATTIVPHAKKVYAVRDLVSQLDKAQCEALWRVDDLLVPAKHELHLLLVLGIKTEDLEKTQDKHFLIIPKEKTFQLREVLSFYLNCLEVVFCAWRHNIAESDFIAEEFGHLIAPPSGHFPLEAIRDATGKYPSIAAFIISRKKELAVDRSRSKRVA